MQRQSPTRVILATLLTATLLMLIGASWHLLGNHNERTRKKMPDLTVPSVIPSDSAQTCRGIPDKSVQALLAVSYTHLTLPTIYSV